ncbi:hypothetical protein ACE3KB_06295 [Enterobacter hormaechei subsp. oharae]
MKALTIEWLNKCRCGNKSHTVKTARGNESALWDDDAVKCNSCGRGGVIQVYEGQARVLWETDEEMAEGKPMSTITREFTKKQLIEQAKKNIEVLRGAVEKIPGASDVAVIHLKLAEITLASLEAEIVGYVDAEYAELLKSGHIESCSVYAEQGEGCITVFSAPPAPVSVPDEGLLHMAASAIEDLLSNKDRSGAGVWSDIPAKLRRAAMLQGAVQQNRQQNIPENIPANTPCKDAPEHIWLQTAGVWPESGEFSELTWCSDNQHEDDTLYVRADVFAGNSPVIPDGWVLVPKEPTEHMIVEGFESEPDEFFSDEEVWEGYDAMSGCQQAAHRAKLCWAAMIAAAPKLKHDLT